MGMTTVRVRISNPADGERFIEQDMLVDSGAYFSVVPRSVLENLGVKPRVKRTFVLADGSQIQRDVGTADFAIGEYLGGSSVIFGEETDKTLLGVLSLEALGLALDPVKGELKPVELLLL